MTSWLNFVGLGIVAACVYGVIHDQITARICVEYFTLGHAPLFATESPTLLGIGWGIIASWWGGAILGLGLAAAARVGRPPKIAASNMIRPVIILLGVMAISALIAGIVGNLAARMGWVYLIGQIAIDVPKEKHPAFLADMWAHGASYLVGFLGGWILIVRTWWSRFGLKPADLGIKPRLGEPAAE